MSEGQHLALGLIIAILLVQWILPDKSGSSKLLRIVSAATGKATGDIVPTFSDTSKVIPNLSGGQGLIPLPGVTQPE